MSGRIDRFKKRKEIIKKISLCHSCVALLIKNWSTSFFAKA